MSKEKVIDANSGSVRKIVTAVIIIFLLLIVLMNSFTTVKAGHSGVVTTFG